MNDSSWFSQISFKQRIWLFATILGMAAVIVPGIFMDSSSKTEGMDNFNIDMSIKDIAPKLNVTGKGLARELDLPLDVSKGQSLKSLDVTPEKLQHAVEHILSHRETTVKYYLFTALVFGGLVFLVRLGRPDSSDITNRSRWYPRTPYTIILMISVIFAGFVLGKSPNPMEGAVKVFKSMVGLYPDPMAKVTALIFFIALAVIGNKMICGWGCPFGALQELEYSIPILKKIKKRKLPFILTNSIRVGLFIAMLLLLFGIIGGRRGFVIYHFMNPFNLFNLDFEALSILMTVIIILSAAFFIYRPFCQFICPFGFVSWIAERFSIFRVRIDAEKCTQCGACNKACPLEAAQGRVDGKRLPADCFSCGRCLKVCPADAIKYNSIFTKGTKEKGEERNNIKN